MSNQKFYTITEQSRFRICISKVDNIEDCVDFMTEEEVRELCGVEEGEHFYIGRDHIFEERVVEVLTNLKTEMVRLNKKSIIIQDEEFLEFIKNDYHSVSDYVKGLRRVGNRLSLHAQKDQTDKINKKTAQSFVYQGAQCISKLLNIEVEIKYVHQNYIGAIEIIKKLLTLEQFEAFITNRNSDGYYNINFESFKQVWENPEQFAPKEVDKK